MFRNEALKLCLNILYFGKQPFKKLLWNIPCTISVLLLAITLINFHRAMKNLYTMDDFNFTNFLIDRVMGCSKKSASYCCFRKAVSRNYFQKVLQINFISAYANWLKNFSFTHFLLIEGYRKYYLRKELVIAPFVERFKAATLRKSSKWTFFLLTAAWLNLSVFVNFLMIEDNEQGALKKDGEITAFVEHLKTITLRKFNW